VRGAQLPAGGAQLPAGGAQLPAGVIQLTAGRSSTVSISTCARASTARKVDSGSAPFQIESKAGPVRSEYAFQARVLGNTVTAGLAATAVCTSTNGLGWLRAKSAEAWASGVGLQWARASCS
jgi:hypothetical protein